MELILVLSALAVSAFFSGIEIAYLSSSKFTIELQRKQGALSARILGFFVMHPPRFICTILVGNNVALVVYGHSMTRLIDPWLLHWFPMLYGSVVPLLVVQTALATLVILVAGEFIPKILFRINPNETLAFFAAPVFVFYVLFYPVVWVILGLSHLLLKRTLGLHIVERKPAFGRIDLDHYVQSLSQAETPEGEGLSEMGMFRAALGFHRIRIRNCMIPRPEIIAMSVDEPVENLRKKFIRTGLSRILVYNESLDHVIGFTHSFELFKRPDSIREVLRPVSVFPESMSARDLLKHFTQEHRSVAVVVDEHGLTAGMVTVEDVIEEIFGEISDEHDRRELVEKRTGRDEYLFSGRLEIDHINERYGLGLPVGAYETLAGFILQHHEHIPRTGEVIVIGAFLAKIERVSPGQIELVRLKRTQPGNAAG